MKNPPYSERVVKLIPKAKIRNPESLQVEINILKKLDHPSVVKLFETFEEEKTLYLVFE